MKKTDIYKVGLMVVLLGLIWGFSSSCLISRQIQPELESVDSVSQFQEWLNRIQVVDDSISTILLSDKKQKEEIKKLQIDIEKCKKDSVRLSVQIVFLKDSIISNATPKELDSLQLLINGLTVNIKALDSIKVEFKSRLSEKRICQIKNNEKLNALKIKRLLICKKAFNFIENFNGPLYFNYNGTRVAAYITDLQRETIRFHLYNHNGTFYSQIQSLKTDLESKSIQPLMITNAGMFKRDLTPVGLFKTTNGETKFALDTVSRPIEDNFHLYPNGVFYIDSIGLPHIQTTIDFYNTYKFNYKSIKLATQSGPMLVINNTIHPKFTQKSINEKVRSGVGVINSCKVVFAATIDNESFYNFSSMLRDIFGCDNALFLDGAISKMYLKGYDQINYSGQFGPMISISEK